MSLFYKPRMFWLGFWKLSKYQLQMQRSGEISLGGPIENPMLVNVYVEITTFYVFINGNC